MKQFDNRILNAIDGSASSNSSAIDASYMQKISVQAVVTGTVQGTCKLQASNDPFSDGTLLTPTNWTDITSGSLTLSSAISFLLAPLDMCFGRIRLVYTATAAGNQTVTTVADVAGSLNSKYFLLDDAASAHKYYVWFNINSAGVDPMVAGRTAVPITGATAVSANTLATSLRSAIGALNGTNSFTTGGSNADVTILNKSVGAFTPAVDGAAPTGFTFLATAGVGTVSVTIKTNGPY